MYQSDSTGTMASRPHFGLVSLSLLLAVLFNLFPYPDQWYSFKPDFVALALAHWAFQPLFGISYICAFLLGIITDVAYTAHFGQHAFAYTVLLFVAFFFRNPFVIAGRLARSVYVFIVLASAQASALAVSMIFEDAIASPWLFVPPLIGAALWLLVPLLMQPARALHPS